ncbi:MAG: hypothetical protein KDH92_02620, partial [Chloroflexi bacterium]|nr:hypothetical protein [Chloroflexota bacterium]
MRDHPEAMRRGGRRRRTVGALAGLLLGLPLACRGDLPVAPEPGGVSNPSSAAVPTASRAPDAGDAAAAPSPTGASPRAPR